MIRASELHLFLETITRAITQDLRPELTSSHARKIADQLTVILQQLTAQARDAERLERLVQPLDAEQRELLARPASRSSCEPAWLRDMIGRSVELWESLESGARPPPPAAGILPTDDDPKTLQMRLDDYLQGKFTDLPRPAIATFAIAAGGTAKRTALFSLAGNSTLPSHLVLRQDLPMNLTGATVVDEYPRLVRLRELGLKVPAPILLEPDANVLGGPFMLVEQVREAQPAGSYFASDRAKEPRRIGAQFARDAARELARLHTLTASEDERASIEGAAAHLAGLHAGYARWNALGKSPGSLIMDLGFQWLLDHPLPAVRPRCLIHGDYGVHNMMVRDGRLVAVLDWELTTEEDPAIDLAQCRMMMVEDTLPWDEFVAEYLDAGGDRRACDPAAVNYYCVWVYIVKYGLMMAEARNAFMQGARNDSLMAVVASQSMDRILQHAARALALAVL